MLPDFYISSSEGHMDGEARSCLVVKQINCAGRNDCLLIKIDPPLRGEKYAMEASEIQMVIIAARLTGNSVISPSKWPVPVYVLHTNVDNVEKRIVINTQEYKVIAWAEIYKDKEQAPPSASYTFG